MIADEQMAQPTEGELLRALRMKHGFNQADVAAASGKAVSRHAVGRVEADDPSLKPATVMMVRLALEKLIRTSPKSERADIRNVVDSLDAVMNSSEPLDPAYYHAASMLRRAREEDVPYMLRDLVRMSLADKERPLRDPDDPEKENE